MKRRPAALATLAALCALALPASAHATYEPIASGQTVLTLDRTLRSLLKENGVTLAGQGGVRVKDRRSPFRQALQELRAIGEISMMTSEVRD